MLKIPAVCETLQVGGSSKTFGEDQSIHRSRHTGSCGETDRARLVPLIPLQYRTHLTNFRCSEGNSRHRASVGRVIYRCQYVNLQSHYVVSSYCFVQRNGHCLVYRKCGASYGRLSCQDRQGRVYSRVELGLALFERCTIHYHIDYPAYTVTLEHLHALCHAT